VSDTCLDEYGRPIIERCKKGDVYCCKCQYLADEADLAFYTSLKFRQHSGQIIHGTDICIVNKEVTKSSVTSAVNLFKQKHIIVDDPNVLNKDNDCKFFKKNFFWPITDIFR